MPRRSGFESSKPSPGATRSGSPRRWPSSSSPKIRPIRLRVSSCPIRVSSSAIPPSATTRLATTPTFRSTGSCIVIPTGVPLKLVAVRAVYCRSSRFRRERVGPGSGSLSEADFAAALEYVRARPAIWEVILTGGDPLTLSPRRIAEATRALAAIPHVKALRWHTRLPVAAPERVTRAMARALIAEGKTTVVAVHANHPRELTEAARHACRRLAAEGAMLGPAKQPASQGRQRRRGDTHRPDARLRRGAGEALLSASWLEPIARHRALARADRQRPGIDAGLTRPSLRDWPCLPTCSTFQVADGKAPIGPQWIHCGEDGTHIVADPHGAEHVYADRLGG